MSSIRSGCVGKGKQAQKPLWDRQFHNYKQCSAVLPNFFAISIVYILNYRRMKKKEHKISQSISSNRIAFKMATLKKKKDGNLLCRIMNKYLQRGLTSGCDEDTGTKFTLLPLTTKKTGNIYKTIIFRYWTIGSSGLSFLRERKQMRYTILPYLLSWRHIPYLGAGKESQPESSGVTDLR